MKPSEIEQLLPWIFQRTLHNNPDNPLHGFIAAMAGLPEPTEEVYTHLHTFFDPYQTPDRFLPFLAQMVALDRYLQDAPPYLPSGTFHLRNLIALAMHLTQERGTLQGLLDFLETATGIPGFTIDDGQQPFHLVVTVPPDAQEYRRLIREIMDAERPAYTTYDLHLAEETATDD